MMLPAYGLPDDQLVGPLAQDVSLRDLYKAVGHYWGIGPDSGGTPRRHTVVEDPSSKEVTAEPAQVTGWVDGIQKRHLLARRGPHRRPVSLEVASAGCLRLGASVPIKPVIRHAIFCSYLDEEWAKRISPGFEVVTSDEHWPEELALAAVTFVDRLRRQVERLACATAPAVPGAVVVRDGNLADDDPARPDLVGVVKQAETEYPGAGDPSELAVGWRGPVLRLLPRRRGGREVWTCHYRLSGAPWLPPLGGVIRIESFNPDLLEPVAAACSLHRQGPASGGARWPVHLRPIADCEKLLREAALPGP